MDKDAEATGLFISVLCLPFIYVHATITNLPEAIDSAVNMSKHFFLLACLSNYIQSIQCKLH